MASKWTTLINKYNKVKLLPQLLVCLSSCSLFKHLLICLQSHFHLQLPWVKGLACKNITTKTQILSKFECRNTSIQTLDLGTTELMSESGQSWHTKQLTQEQFCSGMDFITILNPPSRQPSKKSQSWLPVFRRKKIKTRDEDLNAL